MRLKFSTDGRYELARRDRRHRYVTWNAPVIDTRSSAESCTPLPNSFALDTRIENTLTLAVRSWIAQIQSHIIWNRSVEGGLFKNGGAPWSPTEWIDARLAMTNTDEGDEGNVDDEKHVSK